MKYGLKLDEIKPEDFIFGGGNVPVEVLQADGNWQDFLPVKEFQNLNNVEPYACVIFTMLNCLEAQVKRVYGLEMNWSDRFLATVVNTRGGGCSPHEAAEFLRKIGVVPQDVWPFDSSINTTDKFFEKLPPKLYELAREFNEEWDFRHEFVTPTPEAITEALKCSPLLMSVYAWKREGDIYIKPKGAQDNHATTLFMESEGKWRRVFDSYDSPHIKDVDWKAVPMAIKRFWIRRRKEVKQKISLIETLINALKSLVGLMKEQGITELPKPVVAAPQPQPQPTKREKILAEAKLWLGQDASPLDLAPSERACAEAVSYLLRRCGYGVPQLVSTIDLNNWLRKSPDFKITTEQKPGNIIISPTGSGNGTIVGHVGIFSEKAIMSNDSATGLWLEGYTLDGWITRWRNLGGMPILYYEPVDK